MGAFFQFPTAADWQWLGLFALYTVAIALISGFVGWLISRRPARRRLSEFEERIVQL
jgi:hypothetical protein